MININPYYPLIKVKWPHGGWLWWNWHTCKWEYWEDVEIEE
jgi:hypothetical protein